MFRQIYLGYSKELYFRQKIEQTVEYKVQTDTRVMCTLPTCMYGTCYCCGKGG